MLIDYAKIEKARNYYMSKGYVELSMPWIIGYGAYMETAPSREENKRDFYTLDGYLVASGEQSFIEEMLQEKSVVLDEKGKYFCITPCFRDDTVDEIHMKYFIKLELINTRIEKESLVEMISDAHEFYKQYIPCTSIPIEDGSYDIIENKHKIELGSYGIRESKKENGKTFSWVYGTGLALPRLDIAIKKLHT